LIQGSSKSEELLGLLGLLGFVGLNSTNSRNPMNHVNKKIVLRFKRQRNNGMMEEWNIGRKKLRVTLSHARIE
jgi:hypothetical protein